MTDLEETERALKDAVTRKMNAEVSGDAAEKAAATAAYNVAHQTHWDLKKRADLMSATSPHATTTEMGALNPQVADWFRRATPDVFFLPNDSFTAVSLAADRIFSYFASSRELYRRGNTVVELGSDKRLAVLSSTGFRARLNRRGRRTIVFKAGRNNEIQLAHKLCSEDVAKLLLSASEVDLLPEIKLVVNRPILIEVNGVLTMTAPGYNPGCGVLVTSDVAIPTVALPDAAMQLRSLLRDFNFASPGDESRSLAALIGPGLRMGAFLPGNALVDTVESDQSQAGKGTRLQVVHGIYGERPHSVTQKEGGVGSFDESLGAALISGAPFIVLDNLRGSLRSTYLEHAITPIRADEVSARVPYHGEVKVDAHRTLFQATSNGFSSTIDLANRLLVSRLLKQDPEYAYTPWPEGGLLQRIEKHSVGYLACVQAVIRHWHQAGKPRLPTTHTFKDWVGALDWIVQNVWGAAPLLDGHGGAAARIASPSLTWLRQVALVVLREGQAGKELRTSDLREICERSDLLPEGVKPGWEENAIERALGRTLGSCFARGDTLELDGIHVTRTEREEKRENYLSRQTKFYTFQR